METAKYEGTVQITSAEYRELITEAVEAVKNFERARSENWQLESKINELKKELAETMKELDMCRSQLASFLSSATQSSTWAAQQLQM